MMDMDPEVVETTQALLDAVAEVLGPESDLMPSSAVLIYKTIRSDGSTRMDFVVTHDLDMSDAAGMAAVVHDAALEWFRGQWGEDA